MGSDGATFPTTTRLGAKAKGASALADWLREAWRHDPTLRAVEVEGATVRYRGWGLDDLYKPGLVLVHGFLAHARWWDHIAPRFIDRFRVIAPDLTGMGDSDWRRVYCRRQYGRELIGAAHDAGLKEVIFVGHSFGAASCLYAAMTAPELIRRVVVVDARVFHGELQDTTASKSEKTYASFEAALAHYRLVPTGSWAEPQIADYVGRHSIRQLDRGRWSWKFDPEARRSLRSQRLVEPLRGLRSPVDFIHAANSEVVGSNDLATFLSNMPACGAPVSVPLSHHHIMLEQPVAFVAALNGLLAGHHAGGI